jgi:hypothetical protein
MLLSKMQQEKGWQNTAPSKDADVVGTEDT